MKALRVLSHDGAPVLAEVEPGEPEHGEVRLRIEACGLNHADLLLARGTYQATPEVPFTLGLELCGRVEALGAGVEVPGLGTRVAVYAGQGGLAEAGIFPADRCVAVPDDMPSEVAAGFQIAYGTSHLALTRRGRLAAGETLLVLGAAGGVGLTAVEIGAALGARVLAVARGPDKAEVARAAGAAEVFDSEDPEIKSRLKAEGVDVVYDAVGGELFRAALSACRPEARILLIGFASGTVPEIRANHLLVKNVSVAGVYWGGYLDFAPDVLRESLETCFAWYAEGRLRPHVSHVLPLDRAGEALDLLRSRSATGKVVVRM
ncbi:NADPH:quinone oxidoreductase family protein [Histidinibacterium aquaticum]|uniref:NADPH:quinone oxidoreductase family protein n=1 Tax=Histidinibacterium aquaticum TaxID=2613962 RepID=A0A5J5GP70_9RHOB|nr:NADPH:quinone oxidoreductase family protein [Histidinibacterium aquaticum]KAA9009368.1 NADPH:quinone oxidoreductase family protein [Histidinibacterium aquaticum]